MLTSNELKNLVHILMNIDKDQLERHGIVGVDQVGGSDWSRFTNDPLMFILKVPDDRREKLADLINQLA